jgi:sec-independent protein translocase protein TatB
VGRISRPPIRREHDRLAELRRRIHQGLVRTLGPQLYDESIDESDLERRVREELRKAGDVGLEDVEKTVKDALDEAKRQEHMIRSEYQSTKRSSTDTQAHGPDANNPDNPDPSGLPAKSSDKSPDNRS